LQAIGHGRRSLCDLDVSAAVIVSNGYGGDNILFLAVQKKPLGNEGDEQ
jgi:hypothetical protein